LRRARIRFRASGNHEPVIGVHRFDKNPGDRLANALDRHTLIERDLQRPTGIDDQ
jgi:hypothetical protein